MCVYAAVVSREQVVEATDAERPIGFTNVCLESGLAYKNQFTWKDGPGEQATASEQLRLRTLRQPLGFGNDLLWVSDLPV